MTINDFAVCVTRKEGKKKSISVAQVKEVIRIINQMLDGEVYRIIRKRVS